MVTLSATNCKNFFYRRDSSVLKPRATRAGDKLIPMKDGLIPSIRLLAAAHMLYHGQTVASYLRSLYIAVDHAWTHLQHFKQPE